MKTYIFFIFAAGLILGSCQAPVEKQLFTESADIDHSKKLMTAYLAQDWDAYAELYADTAIIGRNTWKEDEVFTVQQYIDDLKAGIKPMTSYTFENQIWLSGDQWVYFWGVWTAHSEATNKDYEMPVHVATEIVDNKIVQQYEFYNNVEIVLDLMKLAKEKEAAENTEGEEQ